MGVPVATPDDLATFLGAVFDSTATARATLILSLAQNLCEAIVSPLPDTANSVVLEVAARAFENPAQRQQESLGSAHVAYGAMAGGGTVGGLYLSRQDKANLRRLAGGSTAYSVDPLPKGVNEVQTITVTATAGTYTLALNGLSTSALAYNATAADIQSALGALGNIGQGNVTVAGSGPFVVTFVGTMANTPLPILTVDTSSLTGTVGVVETTRGVYAPGAGLPPWSWDYYNDQRINGLPTWY